MAKVALKQISGLRVLRLSGEAPGSLHNHDLNSTTPAIFVEVGAAGLWSAVASGANQIQLQGPEGETFTGAFLILA